MDVRRHEILESSHTRNRRNDLKLPMKRAERIAFVCPRFPENATVGGAETLLRRLAECCAADGRAVTFLTTCAKDHFTWKNELPPGERTLNGLQVRFFPVDSTRNVDSFLRAQDQIVRSGGHVSESVEADWLQNSVTSTALCEHLHAAQNSYDCILAGPYLFGLTYQVASIFNQKVFLVPCLHDEPFAYLQKFRTMFETVRGILFNSLPERELAIRLYGLSTERLHVVGMGMDPFPVDTNAFRSRHNLNAPYLIYSGRREPMKGTPLLLDYLHAFRARTQKNLSLVLTGSGRVDIPPGLAPHVLDAGFLSEEEKHEAMAGALAFCHPSVYESFGIVLLESWLAGTPALVHAQSHVLRHHCERSHGGLWFGNYPEFEESILMLMDDPALQRAMGVAGRNYVLREYAWDRVRKALFQAVDAGN